MYGSVVWEYYEGKVAHFLLIPLNYTNDYNFVLEKLLAQDPFFLSIYFIFCSLIVKICI